MARGKPARVASVGPSDSVPGAGQQSAEADPGQSQRFIEAARELGCEENFAQFEEALKRIVKAKPQPQGPGKPRQA